MPKVHDWFPEFMVALMERTGRFDWPDAASGYWSDFEADLIRKGAQWPEADAAISRACNEPDMFINQYRPFILAEIQRIQRTPPAPVGLATSLDDAAAAARNCCDCGGNGHAVRFIHPDILGRFRTAQGNPLPVGASVGFWCDCQLGRWLASANSRQRTVADDPVLSRSPRPWASMPDGFDCRYRHRPGDWCEPEGRPFAADPWTPTLDALKALVASTRLPKAPGRPILPLTSREAHGEPSSGLPGPSPGRSDLAGGEDDPIIARELTWESDQPGDSHPFEPSPEEEAEYFASLGWV